MKKTIIFLLAALLLCSFGFSAFAEATDEAVPGGYEKYEDDWFNNGYEGIENIPPDEAAENKTPQSWYRNLSVVPLVIGVVIGAAVVFVLYRNSRGESPEAVPYVLRPETSVAAQRDRLADVKRTTRSLSETTAGEKRRSQNEK